MSSPAMLPLSQIHDHCRVGTRRRCQISTWTRIGGAPTIGFREAVEDLPVLQISHWYALHCQCSLHTRASASRGLFCTVEGLARELCHLQDEEGGLHRDGESATHRIQEGETCITGSESEGVVTAYTRKTATSGWRGRPPLPDLGRRGPCTIVERGREGGG